MCPTIREGLATPLSRLAKVPALSCRLGHIPYDRALMGDSIPYNCAFGSLIVRFLSITKKFEDKKGLCQDSNLYLKIHTLMHYHHSTHIDIHLGEGEKCNIYC